MEIVWLVDFWQRITDQSCQNVSCTLSSKTFLYCWRS